MLLVFLHTLEVFKIVFGCFGGVLMVTDGQKEGRTSKAPESYAGDIGARRVGVEMAGARQRPRPELRGAFPKKRHRPPGTADQEGSLAGALLRSFHLDRLYCGDELSHCGDRLPARTCVLSSVIVFLHHS